MKEKLQILIETENLTPSGLARKLEVNPPVISHILKGRNQPSYELIRKIINRFPQINPYWLLGDSNEMFNPAATKSDQHTTPTQHKLFPYTTELHCEESSDTESNIIKSETDSGQQMPLYNNVQSADSEIERIIIIYKNGTFEPLIQKK